MTDVLSSKVTVLGSVAETHQMFSALLKVPRATPITYCSGASFQEQHRDAWEEFSFLGRYFKLLL